MKNRVPPGPKALEKCAHNRSVASKRKRKVSYRIPKSDSYLLIPKCLLSEWA
jgi:hypothetical protein